MAFSKNIAELFGKERSTITEHLIKHIFEANELEENSVCRHFRHTAQDGKEYNTKFYNLKAITAVGYRVNSQKATAFRKWATEILHEYIIKGHFVGVFHNSKSTLCETPTERQTRQLRK